MLKKIIELTDEDIGCHLTIQGILTIVQEHKKFYIMKISDSTEQKQLQLIFDLEKIALYYRDVPAKIEKIKDFTRGLHIKVTGKMVKPQEGKESMEMQVSSATYYGKLDASTYPFPKLKRGEKTDIVPLRQQPSLRFRSSIFQHIMRIRHTCAMATHEYFDKKGMLWLHTPILTAADCEGAGETLLVKDSKKFFSTAQDVGLTVSGQLHGEGGALG